MDINELRRLQEINQLLDEKNQEVGIRSLYPNDDYVDPEYSKKIESAFQNKKSLRLAEINNGDSSSVTSFINHTGNDSLSLISKIGIFMFLIVLFVLVINSDIRETGLKLINLFPEEQSIEKLSFAQAGSQKKIMKVIDLQDRPVIIASGSFRTKYEADKAYNELYKLAGKTLKVVKLNDFYTVQFGPEYNDYDDAMTVFKELVKYQIKDLSIKVK